MKQGLIPFGIANLWKKSNWNHDKLRNRLVEHIFIGNNVKARKSDVSHQKSVESILIRINQLVDCQMQWSRLDEFFFAYGAKIILAKVRSYTMS